MLINNCLNFMILVMYLNLNLFTFCRSYASSQKHRRCTQYFEFQPRQSSPPLPYSAVESIRRSFLLAEVRTASPEQSNSVFSWWEKYSHESHLIRAIPGVFRAFWVAWVPQHDVIFLENPIPTLSLISPISSLYFKKSVLVSLQEIKSQTCLLLLFKKNNPKIHIKVDVLHYPIFLLWFLCMCVRDAFWTASRHCFNRGFKHLTKEVNHP